MTLVSGSQLCSSLREEPSRKRESKCQGQEARGPARKPGSPERREGESGGDKVEVEMGASSDGIS